MLIERVRKILADLDQLTDVIPSFGPFLELGAGSAQRSAALMNRYPVDGVATDISQSSLRNAPYVMSLLNFTRSPC